MVSVIVPVYNAEFTLVRCVDSLLTQTYQDIEIILIDDGSTDNSYSICQAYTQKDARVKVLQKENGGVSSARNLGMKHAHGDWMGFVDADDYVNPQFISNFFLLGDDADLLVQGFYQIDLLNNSSTNIYEPTAIIKGDAIYDYAIKTKQTHQLGCIWCKLYKSDIIHSKDVYYIESFYQCEDLLFCMHYLKYVRRIINLANADQYVYLREVYKGKYKQQDFIEMFYQQLFAMQQVCGAERRENELKGLFAKDIIDYYIYGRYRATKRNHIDRFIDELYSYRTFYPIRQYRLISRIFVYLSLLSDNKCYSKCLLILFSYNIIGK